MNSIVVYESLWGNTAAVAHAIAEGIGHGIAALSTTEATPEWIAGADLVVAGAPVLGFRLPTEAMRNNLGPHEAKAPTPPDLSNPSLRSWLDKLEPGNGRAAAFETRIRWSPGGATAAILSGLERAGYTRCTDGARFVVTGTYGPLLDGELERARAWGESLASKL